MKNFFTQTLISLILLTLIFSNPALAQGQPEKDKPTTLKHWMTPEEAKLRHLIGANKAVTDPPDGPVTNLAEFDKMQSVLIRYPFGLPYNLIAEMSQECIVTTIVASTSEQTYVTNQYNNQGVNLDNCEFIIAPSNSYWTRDYGPWFVFDGNDELGIIDFTYNRPRPADNAIPSVVAQEYGFNLFEMDIETAGGNYMTNGMGISSSSQLIWDENPSYTHDEIAQIFENYLGIETYHVVQDPNNTYIDHIDCWGKFLDIDKVLIRSVPQSHPQYDEIEETAAYYAAQTSSYGTPFQVSRVYTPNNEPYTNSLILNKRVYVPIMNGQWDDEALASYEEAMPGYEIFGFTGSWESTDALHCRTKGIADLNMVHINHVALLGEQPVQENYQLEATIKAFSGAALHNDSVLIYYRINGGNWEILNMTNTSGQLWTGLIPGAGQGSQIDYYLYAADQNGNHQNHPFIGQPDPHQFFVGEQAFAQISITPDEISASAQMEQSTSEILTICNTGQLDLNYSIETNTAVYGNVVQNVPDSPTASSYQYNTWDEAGWTEFEVSETGTLAGVQITFNWASDNWPEEGSFHLLSPGGTSAAIFTGSPSGNYSVDMIAFNDEDMNGTWRMWIEDTYGDGGHQATAIELAFSYVLSEIEWLAANAATGTVAPGDCAEVSIVCDASEMEPGLHEGLLTVSSNDPDFPVTEVPVHFEVTELGYLTIEPDTMWVLTEGDIFQMATIVNNSNADVEVSEIQEQGFDWFGWNTEQLSQTLPHTLQPGDEMTFWVSIWPGVFDNFFNLAYDSVQITSNAGNYYMTLAVNTDLLGSVDDPDKIKINTFPSPFTNQLTIELKNFNEDINKVIVTDLNGRLVKQFSTESIINRNLIWNTDESSQKIDPGIYLIQIFSGNKSDVIKVIKMNDF
ncbi:MAG: agmatine deiminase family protein [Bacteroidales bacterium]|nr:agmatine deiminase family protein [Bacteroidales bacterium]